MKKLLTIFALALAVGCASVSPAALAKAKKTTTTTCNHSWQKTKDRSWAATCTKRGRQHYVCRLCGIGKNENLSATGHSYGNWRTQSWPTCTKPQTQVRTCRKCGKKDTRTQGYALGHNYKTNHKGQSVCIRCNKKTYLPEDH